MYKCYHLDLGNSNTPERLMEEFRKYISEGKVIYENNQSLLNKNFEKTLEMGKDLSAEDIMSNWFPEIEADIFLSHSHKDEELIFSLAGFLKKELNLKVFIDSAAWGYSDDLLKKIDDTYCLNNNKNTYSYEKRNKSTSHIHMMLLVSLVKMINKCECLFFINTPSSFKPSETITNEGITTSPWIYSELYLSSIIKTITPNRLKIKAYDSSAGNLSFESLDEALRIDYDIKIDHLEGLTLNSLIQWKNLFQNKAIQNALDLLYKATEVKI